jgi:hypothetical protein
MVDGESTSVGREEEEEDRGDSGLAQEWCAAPRPAPPSSVYRPPPLPQLAASNTAQGPPLALSGQPTQRKSTKNDEFAPFRQKLAFTLNFFYHQITVRNKLICMFLSCKDFGYINFKKHAHFEQLYSLDLACLVRVPQINGAAPNLMPPWLALETVSSVNGWR